jgi:prolyl oligopeptidase
MVMRMMVAAAVVACGVTLGWCAEAHPTKEKVVKETIHGVEISDPYRWLEGDENGKATPEVKKWTEEQNARTREILDHLPGREKLEKRLAEVMQMRAIRAPEMAANRYFYTKREGRQNQAVLYMREGANGAPRELIDANKLDKDGLVTLSWFDPSQDGKLLAFGIYRSGDENDVLHVLDVASGKWLDDQIEGRVRDVQWEPDGKGLFYRRLEDVSKPYSGQICYHRLGEKQGEDRVLFEQYKTGPLATTWGPYASVGRDGQWMVLSYATGTKSNDLFVIDLEKWRKSGAFDLKVVSRGEDAAFHGGALGDRLYMETTLDAPNGRIVLVDMKHPEKEAWKEIIPERKDAVIETFSIAKGMLVVRYQKKASTRIELFDLEGKSIHELSLPGIGSASVSTQEDRTEAFLSYTSFNQPPIIYHIDLASGKANAEVWEKSDVPFDPSTMEVKQVFYPSKDGTNVSMFVVHRRGMVLNGNNPTLLTGYGGFGNGITPSFGPTLLPWLEAGGVFAIANLRGGNEYGEKWHEAGMLEHKQNVFDDFIAAGEYLIREKYTRAAKLGISGGSNGGLLVGAAVTQRPDLWGAVVCHVPLLDMIRYQKFLMARYWVPEYGSAEDAAQFEYLLKYSPYHHVKAGVKYPAILFTAGEHDARVHAMHARKMGALMQQVSGSDQARKPILVWVEQEAGHGMGKPLNLRVRAAADDYAFLMWQLGAGPTAAD